MSPRPARIVFTIVMDLLIVVAVVVAFSMVVRFFGALAAQPWADAITLIAGLMTLPLGIELIKTPYGGVFDPSAATTVAVLLFAEWMLSVARARG